MKFTKTHEKALREFMAVADENGVATAECWTSGSFAHTSNRALPPFVERHNRREYPDCGKPAHGTTERTAMEFFDRNPRRKVCLVLDRDALMSFLFDAARGREM